MTGYVRTLDGRMVKIITWLDRIEQLQPGDFCEIWSGTDWEAARVIHNGMAYMWSAKMLVDGRVRNVMIEHVRCQGQIEAWPGSGRVGRCDYGRMIIDHHLRTLVVPPISMQLCAALEGVSPIAYAKRIGEDTWGGMMAEHLAEAYAP